MCVSNTLTQTLLFLIFVSKVFCGRKYDIEAESLKLYKEDVKSVLQHFRRTPDYLKILEDKNTEFAYYVIDISAQIQFFYTDQMRSKVKEMLGIKPTTPSDEPKPTTTPASALIFRSGRNHHRRDDGDPNKSTPTPIEVLDSYYMLTSHLTVAQRNAMKELGFTYTGYIIHAIIKNLGSESDVKSTQQPSGGNQNDKETTEHVSVHTVTGSTKHAPTTEEPGEDGKGGREGREGDNNNMEDHTETEQPTYRHHIRN